MTILKTFFDLLTSRERRNLYLLFVAVIIMAGLEVVSVASIMPFLSVAADPGTVHENPYLNWTFETFGFAETDTFLIALGMAALTALVVSNAFIVLTTWALYRYAWGRNHSISRRLLFNYLNRPYDYFLTRNSSELGKNILSEVKELVTGMLRPGLRGLAKAIVALFIVIFLVFINPQIAIGVAVVLGGAYLIIYLSIKNKIDTYGEKRIEANTKRYKVVYEAFGGIKEVKLWGKENAFVRKYEEPSRRFSRYQIKYSVLKKVPRYILEAVAFGGIIIIAIYIISIQDNIQQVIPVLGLYAFAGYRLMPALQQAFRGLASAKYNVAALREVERGMQETGPLSEKGPKIKEREENSKELLNRSLLFDDVYYTYPNADSPSIKGISFEVPCRSTIGIVGETGSGKTTTVDLALGLLRPQKGSIYVDGNELKSENIGNWQNNIGYVPQQIFLADTTIARNIAFGVPNEEIDMEIVKDVAKRAHIYDFVHEELPNQWESVVGERGVRLSGGQRQRVGIARALYHNPSVLVFDEATSALDQATEAKVMEAIYELEGNHTMIVIAHRLSTVRRVDNIIMLDDGEIVGRGSYEKISQNSSHFRSMVLS